MMKMMMGFIPFLGRAEGRRMDEKHFLLYCRFKTLDGERFCIIFNVCALDWIVAKE
jgi:hypothetical protein